MQTDLPTTPRFNKALAIAQKEAKKWGHNWLGTEHLLLGILQSDGMTSKLLNERGIMADEIRDALNKKLNESPSLTIKQLEQRVAELTSLLEVERKKNQA